MDRDMKRLRPTVPEVSGRPETEEPIRRESLLLELSPVLMRDPEDRIIYWNRAAEIMYGFTREQALGRFSQELLRRELPEPLEQILARLRSGTPWQGELQVTRSDGAEITVASEWIAYLDDRGRLEAIIEVNTEVTERKRAEEARDRLAAIIDSSEDAIISKNLDGIVTSWNASAERLFGYRADEMIGQPIGRIIPPERQAEEGRILERLGRGERIGHYETERIAKDGRRVEVSLTMSSIRDSSGAIIGASKIARDITERRQKETELRAARAAVESQAENLETIVAHRTARLRESVAELEGFSDTVSHDLRAPLRAISAFTNVVLEDYGAGLSSEVSELLHKVVGAAGRMDRLLQDLVAFSRVSRQSIELGAVDLDHLVLDIALARPELQMAVAEIKVESPLLPMLGHEVLLSHCVTNLLSNAVKFVGPGVKPRIHVFSERLGERVRLWVQDNGIGIERAQHEKIFEMFHRLSNDYEGTGMGLAIVKKAAERMGGRVGVESEPGKGSRFYVELPAPTV
jgi:PAS domain S-box-containing protein